MWSRLQWPLRCQTNQLLRIVCRLTWIRSRIKPEVNCQGRYFQHHERIMNSCVNLCWSRWCDKEKGFYLERNYSTFQCDNIFMISNYLSYNTFNTTDYTINNLISWIRCCHIETLSNSFSDKSLFLCRIKWDQYKFTQVYIATMRLINNIPIRILLERLTYILFYTYIL